MAFEDFLKNENQAFAIGASTFEGVDTSKPLFCHLGFSFPHTPVLPPADYRARFAEKKYKVPAFDKKEFETMPVQLQTQVKKSFTDNFTEADKQTMIQDYFTMMHDSFSLMWLESV